MKLVDETVYLTIRSFDLVVDRTLATDCRRARHDGHTEAYSKYLREDGRRRREKSRSLVVCFSLEEHNYRRA